MRATSSSTAPRSRSTPKSKWATSRARPSSARCGGGEAEIDKTWKIMRKQRVSLRAGDRAAESGDRPSRWITWAKIDGEPFEGGSAGGVTSGGAGKGASCRNSRSNVVGHEGGRFKTFEHDLSRRLSRQGSGRQDRGFEVTVSEVQAPRCPKSMPSSRRTLGVADGDLGKMRARSGPIWSARCSAAQAGARQGPGDEGACYDNVQPSNCPARWSKWKSGG
jgi:hypothetical protein